MSKKPYVSYYEKLKDPRWQQMRLEIMKRDDFACLECGDKTTTLNVHHTYYEQGKDPWDYAPESLRTLCEPHHKEIEDLRRQILMRVHTTGGHRRLLSLISAMGGNESYGDTFAPAMRAFERFFGQWDAFHNEGVDKIAAERSLCAAMGEVMMHSTRAIQDAVAAIAQRNPSTDLRKRRAA